VWKRGIIKKGFIKIKTVIPQIALSKDPKTDYGNVERNEFI